MRNEVSIKWQISLVFFNNFVLYHSVALAFSAIRLLQNAKIFRTAVTHFQEEKDERECLVCVGICFKLLLLSI